MALIESDVLSWQDFSEGSGTSVADESGNSNTISLVNTPSWGTSGVPSGLNGFITLNGSTQYGTYATDDIANTNNQSVAVWVRVNTAANTWVFSNRAASTTNYGQLVELTSGTTMTTRIRSTSSGDATSGSIGTTWHLYIITYTSSGVNMYVDNSAVGLDTGNTGGIGTNTNGLFLGQRGNGSGHFNGDIAQTIYFNKELSAAEAGEIWASGNGTTFDTLFAAPAASGFSQSVIIM